MFPVSSLGHSVLVPAWIGGSWETLVTQSSQADNGSSFYPGSGSARARDAAPDTARGPRPSPRPGAPLPGPDVGLGLVVCHYGTIRCALALGHPRGLGAWREFKVGNAGLVALAEAARAVLES